MATRMGLEGLVNSLALVMLWQVCVDVCRNLTCLEFAVKTCYRTRRNGGASWKNWNFRKLSRVVWNGILWQMTFQKQNKCQLYWALSVIRHTACWEICVRRLSLQLSKTFSHFTEILGKHLSPKPPVIAERFRFEERPARRRNSRAICCTH